MIPKKNLLKAVLLGALMSTGVATFLVVPPALEAQADLGSISGVVTDASGAVVGKATVKVTNTATGAVRVTSTNSKGEYSVAQLNPGNYSVDITAEGFQTAVQSVTVSVGSTNAVSAKLAVAGGRTEVVVSADDFAGVQLDKAEISSVIDSEQIQSLPTLDRNPYNLVAFSGNLSADPTAASRGVGFNISGARSSSVDILLDGAENTDLYAVGIAQTVPMDATQEIRIVTSNAGAEYGRGAGAVNVSTKSGTNGLHGSVYEFNRISTLASAGYNNNYIHALNPDVAAKPRYTHNQFGYSVGGPVKHDKLFFFSSTEWTRIRSAQNEIAVVPTPDLIGMSAPNMQDFFNTYGALAHPINGQTYTGASPAVTKVFGSDIVDIGTAQMGLTPDANNPITGCDDPRIAASPICTRTLFGEAIYQAPQDSGGGAPVNQWLTFNRGDWTINQTTSLFVRYIQQSAINPAGYINYSPYQGYNTDQTQFNHNLEFSLSHAFSPTLASATKVLGSRVNNAQPLAQRPVSPTLYVNGSTPVSLGGGEINFPGYSQLTPGNSIPFGGPQNFIQVGEDLAWTKGRHQLAIGGQFLFIKDNRTFGAYEEAVDGLVQSGHVGALDNFVSGGLGLLQVALDPKGTFPCTRDVATGKYPTDISNCSIQLPATSPNFSRSNRYQDGAAYVSDSYKATPKLTLNLGLRWEIYGPQHSQRASYDSNFFFGPGDTEFEQIRNGSLKTRETAPNGRLWNLNTRQFAPKVGFAYDPVGDGKTSIRGGFGLSYERNFNNVTFNVIQNPPNYAVISFTPADLDGANIPISTNNFSTFGTSTGPYRLPNTTLRAVDPKIKPVYAENYSLSVEHQFHGTTGSLSYVGTRGIHNYSIANINRSYYGSTYLGDTHTSNRLNLQYSNINFRGADGDSYYNGLTAEIRSANLLQTGLNIRGDYTLSHSIDNTSSTFTDGGANNDNLGYLDPFNKALDRGSSDFDQKHRVAAAIVWNIPFAHNMQGAARTFADNWTLSTTFTAQTGTPFSMFDCYYAVTVCPRASFASAVPHQRTGGMKDISADLGSPNTYSYIAFPSYYDADGNPDTTNYNEQVNPRTGSSDIPICAGLNNGGCHFVPGMTGRNEFRGPGNWNENLGVVKEFKMRERYTLQFKAEFINVFNHANTLLNLGGTNDVSSYTDVLAYKGGINGSSSLPANRNTELSLHLAF